MKKTFDEKTLDLFVGYGNKHKKFSKRMGYVVNWSFYVFVVLFILGAVYLYFFNISQLGFYIIAPLFCLATSISLRQILKKPRPYESFVFDMPANVKKSKRYSSPSNHSASAFVIGMSFIFVNPIAGVIVLFLAVITGIARVFTGIHYLSDVLLGWGIGFIFGIVGGFILPYI